VKPFQTHFIKNSNETDFDEAYTTLTGYSQFSYKAKQIVLNENKNETKKK